MSKVYDFLNEAGVFFLASVDGDQAKVRPLGLHFEVNDTVYFGVGDFKDCYRQMAANPKIEIVAVKPNSPHWLRYTGKAVFETDFKLAEAALEQAPHLRAIYNDETGHKMMIFHLEDAEAYDINMMPPGESLL